ncbi:MAG: sensor histidine kinase [Clostridia bacterium]|nr:sensor histidine kinase [Clostridia bacterium]
MDTFLDVFDLFRFMGGTLIADFIFTLGVSRRNKFWLRAFLGLIVGLFLSLGYLLIAAYYENGGNFYVFGIVGAIWWALMSFSGILYLLFCFKIGPCGALYRALFGSLTQHICTIILRYWFVRTIFPDFPQTHTMAYLLLTVAVYVLIYIPTYFLSTRFINSGKSLPIEESKKNFVLYTATMVILSIVSSLVGGVMDWVLNDLHLYPELAREGILFRYFCIGVSFLYCIAFLIFGIQSRMVDSLRRENAFIMSITEEKGRQYEISRQNIEIINRKCHDLKQQIRALRYASEEEREKLFEETNKAIMIYDCGFHTDNEALNVLLTEKNLYCIDRKIRLSCTIHTEGIEKLNVIDLYTMLGNAIDNAIESVQKHSNPDKKTISLTIEQSGGLLCFQIDNYYEGVINLKNGLPETSKEDKENHGIGIKSIKLIAEKYGGTIQIKAGEEVFSLRIIIPITKG